MEQPSQQRTFIIRQVRIGPPTLVAAAFSCGHGTGAVTVAVVEHAAALAEDGGGEEQEEHEGGHGGQHTVQRGSAWMRLCAGVIVEGGSCEVAGWVVWLSVGDLASSYSLLLQGGDVGERGKETRRSKSVPAAGSAFIDLIQAIDLARALKRA